MPSQTCCVRLVSSVFMECAGRNPWFVGAGGTSGWIMLYKTFCVMGILEEFVFGPLLGLSTVKILSCFQMLVIKQWA